MRRYFKTAYITGAVATGVYESYKTVSANNYKGLNMEDRVFESTCGEIVGFSYGVSKFIMFPLWAFPYFYCKYGN